MWLCVFLFCDKEKGAEHFMWNLPQKFRNFGSESQKSQLYFRNFRDFRISDRKHKVFYIRTEKSAQKGSFLAGCPQARPAKSFGQALQFLEKKKKQAFWHGHAARTSTKRLPSEKLRADSSFPESSR